MRNLILSALLATAVAMPATAQDRDFRQRDRAAQSDGEPRSEARAERRAQRAERATIERPQADERVERSARRDGEQQQVRERAFDRQGGERRDWGRRRSNNDGMTAAIERQQDAARIREQGQLVEQRRDGVRVGRSRDGSLLGRAMENSQSVNGQVGVRRDRDDRRTRYSGVDRRWSSDWRRDRNYDWRNHRNYNRSAYRLGYYRDPYGSRYRRFSIGFSLFPNYYQSNYWLSDPWQYRLPPAYGPYRWVRYYDDALLVNIYTGQVVDVEYNFFW